ncbi:hypothetical protein AKJ09_01074 [Labilithrix luteola]|uniref:Uncharacterized protein n=1 Tax=Labilithrix luteola TaxID=1391654 RepID=A0A0K1PLK9_9BACT|nr:hypothetical protein [Labilithrix luteola]AKU94410.1 hypothetical protein AKJ09_01074 [Labilithrix luteola]
MGASRLATGIAACAFALACGCKKTTPPSSAPDASASDADAAAAPVVRSSPPRDGGNPLASPPPRPDAGAPPVAASTPLAPLPLVSDGLELVAIGTTFNSKILWLQEIGDRVWLSARNLDAYAEGDGALVKGPDLLAKFPYKPGVHNMQVVGAYPHLFALRTKSVNGRMESPEPTLFVYHPEAAGPGAWQEAKPLGMDWYPLGFLAYREGALIVSGQIMWNANPYYSPPAPGTSLTYLAPDGSLSDAGVSLHPHFLGWTASSDRSTLTLVGTIATPPKGDDPMFGYSGIHVARITKEGTKMIPIQRDFGMSVDAYSVNVHETGSAALVVPPGSAFTAEGWKPDVLTTFILNGDKPQPRKVAGNESCSLTTARLAGDTVYAIRRCYTQTIQEELVRVGPDGKTLKLPMPRLVKKAGGGFRAATSDAEKAKAFACIPTSIVLRGQDDLWVAGKCGDGGAFDGPAIPIVLRRGRPQEPVTIP